jgi:hypothetical protein
MTGVIESPAVEAGEAPSRARAVVPMCPRCGYDQSGVIDSWKENCPLYGTCSECGLELDWKVVLDPTLRGPRWSFEHGPRWSLRRFAATALRALLPRLLFGQFVMSDDIVLRRLMWFAAMSLLMMAVLLHVAKVVLNVYWWFVNGWGWGWGLSRSLFWPYRQRDLFTYSSALVLIYLPQVALVLLLGILDETLARARVRKVHLVRGLCYSLPAAALVLPLLTGGLVVLAAIIPRFSGPDEWFLLGAAALWGTWSGFWWWVFLSLYLRMRRAALIVGVLMVPAVLLTVVVGVGLFMLALHMF